MSQIKRIAIIIIFVALSIAVFFLVDFFDVAHVNPNLILNLSNLLIILYTSLTAILFSILGIHLSRQYGVSSIDILVKKSKRVFAIYSLAIFISILGMIFGSKALEVITLEIAMVSINATSIMLGAEIIVGMFSAYFFPKYLLEIFRISPAQIMKTLGYPDEIVKLVKRGHLYETSTKLSRGLSLIRICIMDLAMRDELEAVVSTFSKTIEEIPWHQKEEELHEKEKIDMKALSWKFHRKLDESIFSPLINTELKPDIHLFSALFCSFTKMYINTNLLNSSLFDEYLDELYKVTTNYVMTNKEESLSSFFFGAVLWPFGEKLNKISDQAVSRVLSKGVVLSASLIESLETEPDKKYEITYLLFVAFSNLHRWLKKYPRAFMHTGATEIGDLIYLMEKGGRIEIASVIIALFHIESELGKIRETEHPFVHERTVANFNKIKSKVIEILERNHWRIFISENALNVLKMDDRTIGAFQLANILDEDEVKALKSFIKKQFTPFFLEV